MATRNTVWRWNDMRNQRKNRKAPLEQLMEGWLLWGNFSPRTRQGYAEVFAGFLAWMREQGHEGILGELEPLLVRKWQQWLEEMGCSVNTVRGYLATLKSFSRYLAEERIVLGKGEQPLNLLADVKVPKLPRSRPQVYSDAEIEKVLDGINRDRQYGARNLALIHLMLDGGLRLNEACSVLTDDINFETGRILVRWQIAKRKKERETWVGKKTLSDLYRYLIEFRPDDARIPELFVDQDGGPLTPHAIQCYLGRLRRKLGLKHLSAHQFRRTWATNYRKHGVGDLFDLQVEGGWEDLSVPQRFYVDVDPQRPGRPSMLDRWEQTRRKEQRRQNSPVQVRTPLRVRGDDSGESGAQNPENVSVRRPLPGRKVRGYTG